MRYISLRRLIILKLFFILSIILLFQNLNARRIQKALILPLINRSGFHNQWKLEESLPEYFAIYLDSLPGFLVTSNDSVSQLIDRINIRRGKTPEIRQIQIFKESNIDWVLSGVLTNFEINRTQIGNPLLAGLANYKCYIKIRFSLMSTDAESESFVFFVETQRENHSLQFTPQGMGYKPILRFTDLDTMKFNSPIFRSTLVGKTLYAAAVQLRSKVASALKISTPALKLSDNFLLAGKVLSITGDRIHISIGSAEGLAPRQHYIIYLKNPDSDKLVRSGELEIVMVKDTHISMGRVLDKSVLDMQVGDEIILQQR